MHTCDDPFNLASCPGHALLRSLSESERCLIDHSFHCRFDEVLLLLPSATTCTHPFDPPPWLCPAHRFQTALGHRFSPASPSPGLESPRARRPAPCAPFVGRALPAVIAVAMNVISWAISTGFKTEKLYDLTGALTNLAILTLTLNPGSDTAPTVRQLLASAMVAAWTLRLGSFLFVRALKWGDSRFHEALHAPAKFLVFFLIQAVWCFLNTFPVVVVNSVEVNPGTLQPQDVIGLILWAAGMLLECTADFQKYAFKGDPSNKGKFVDVGVWRYARYPNYGGEMMLWWGLWIFCTSMFRGWQFVSVVSPLFTMLILFKASGIPLQEAQQQERWGSDPEFLQWRASTSLLFPLPWKAYVRGGSGSKREKLLASDAAASSKSQASK